MKVEPVEIYSDRSNAAIMRHPGRNFPGVLVQGDTLWTLTSRADWLCKNLRGHVGTEAYQELNDLRNTLQGVLSHYKETLAAYGMRLPFSEQEPL
jgi:hypothetical protein